MMRKNKENEGRKKLIVDIHCHGHKHRKFEIGRGKSKDELGRILENCKAKDKNRV